MQNSSDTDVLAATNANRSNHPKTTWNLQSESKRTCLNEHHPRTSDHPGDIRDEMVFRYANSPFDATGPAHVPHKARRLSVGWPGVVLASDAPSCLFRSTFAKAIAPTCSAFDDSRSIACAA